MKAEREHNCGKIQVFPTLPDTVEGTGAPHDFLSMGMIKFLNTLLPPSSLKNPV
jgi:hypothetical protein